MSEPETPVPNSQDTWSTNFAMMVRICGAFSDEQLRLALARVRAGHPALLQRQLEDGSIQALSLQEPPEFPLDVRTGCTETDWIDVTRAELRQRFSPEGPLARFVLLRLPQGGADLVAVFHHWVAEGMSGVYVVRDTLRLLGDPAADLPAIPIPPNMISLIPKTVTQDPRTRFRIWQEINTLRFSLLRNRLRKKVRPVFSEEQLALKRDVCLLPGGLSVEQTAALLARCRAEGTSVHAAVSIAWMRAYAEMLEDRKSWVRTASSPVNVRNRLAQPIPETCGGYLCIVETSVDCAPSRDFWQAAREFKQRLTQSSTGHRLFVQELTMSKIETSFPKSQLFEAFLTYFSRGDKYDFSVTNLGQVDIPTTAGPLTVEAFHGPLVNSMEEERTVGVTTFAGKLTFALLFRRSGLDPARAGQLLQRAIACLVEAVSSRAAKSSKNGA